MIHAAVYSGLRQALLSGLPVAIICANSHEIDRIAELVVSSLAERRISSEYDRARRVVIAGGRVEFRFYTAREDNRTEGVNFSEVYIDHYARHYRDRQDPWWESRAWGAKSG
jgi:hypothetical protein